MKPKGDDFQTDFFCIGAAKCRTTWLAHCLDEHPEVAISKVKEPDFFSQSLGLFIMHDNPSFLKDWDWYTSLWDHAPADAVKGDFSIALLNNYETAPKAIKEYCPDAKFLVSLRDPVKRAYSHYWHHYARNRHWGNIPDTFEEAMTDTTLLKRSMYAAALEHWFKVFPKDQFHVVTDLDYKADQLAAVQGVYRFLGVDDSFVPEQSLNVRINPTQGRRGVYGSMYRTSQRLRKVGMGPVINLAKRMRVTKLINKMDWHEFEYPPLDAKVAARMRELLRPDVERLESMLGRDFTPWKVGGQDGQPRTLPPKAKMKLEMRPGNRTRPEAQENAVLKR